jgi:copper homeostasis protein
MSVLLEVIATTVADARLAAQAGADRLELVTAMGEGGLTPSIGLIEAVVDAVTAVLSSTTPTTSR